PHPWQQDIDECQKEKYKDAHEEKVEYGRADKPGRDPQREAGGHRRPPPPRWHQVFPRTGTRICSRSSARTDFGVRPPIAASADSRMRWDRTGTTSSLMSSGIT